MTPTGEGPEETQTHPETRSEPRRDPEAPSAKPGWYTDPDQPQTVRYWDGDTWTEQRAPASASSDLKYSLPRSFLVLAGMVGAGALITVVGLFLPAAEISAPIPIPDNSLVQQDHAFGVGFFLILSVLLTADVLNRRAAKLRLLLPMMFSGVMIALIAFRFSQDMPYEPSNRFAERVLEQVDLSAGAGVWAVGLGGALIAIAALVTMLTGDEDG